MALSYCAMQVRTQDIDRFHLAACVPRWGQEDWLALAAFNLELARTAHRVSDPNLGLIRLQWWREVLTEIEDGGAVRAHQVALALHQIGPRLNLPPLYKMIEARTQDLEAAPFAHLEDLRRYLMHISGALLIAQAYALNLRGIEGMANHLGCSFGFIGLARTLAAGKTPWHRLPQDWQDDPFEGVVHAVDQATLHLDRAQELRKTHEDPKSLSCIFAVEFLLERWIKALSHGRKNSRINQGFYTRPLPFQALRLALRS